MNPKPTIKQILADNRSLWENAQTPPAVRENFQKVIDCRTFALGAEVYASNNGERKHFPHTCKSRACPSCGWRATLTWQREVAAMLPEIPFAGVCLTMHSDFWPIFQQNRSLLDDLPAIGAGVLQDLGGTKLWRSDRCSGGPSHLRRSSQLQRASSHSGFDRGPCQDKRPIGL